MILFLDLFCILLLNWDRAFMATLFEDFIQSGEDWMSSSMNVRLSVSNTQKRRGRHTMLPYHEVKKRFGGAIATQILADKQNMEKSKAKGDSTVYFMEHPEARGQEDSQFQKINDAL